MAPPVDDGLTAQTHLRAGWFAVAAFSVASRAAVGPRFRTMQQVFRRDGRVADSELSRRSFLRRSGSLAGSCLLLGGVSARGAEQARKAPELAFSQGEDHVQLELGALRVLRYQLRPLASGGPAVESACYLHPLSTPKGTVVTDVAPDDHPHHRGVFLSWVEMHGAKDADFWGWGEHAPIEGRRIVNKSVDAQPPALGAAKLAVTNEWMADGVRMLTEESRFGAELRDGGTLLDYSVRLTADADVTLARWAFSGFAVRLRKDADITALSAEGPVSRPVPKHTDPDSNWPDARWYGLHLKFKDGAEATVVVVGRKSNPPTNWHVVPGTGLLNPSITGPASVKIRADKPLVLRYRVIAFDGPPRLPVIQALADPWYTA